MSAVKTRKTAQPRRIDKLLFEAGSQCAKRLFLEARESQDSVESERKALSEAGDRLLELACKAFPGTVVEAEDRTKAAAETKSLLSQSSTAVVFDGVFRSENTEVETDIVVRAGEGAVEIFEVKAGTTIKPRHLLDVAMQIHAIEASGWQVAKATILHVNSRYRHQGGDAYPIHQLFKNVDVTERARKLVPKVGEQVPKFLDELGDEKVLDLPTGTWCYHPLPCRFLPRCLAEGPENPLIHLPQLTPQQERRLMEQGTRELGAIDRKQAGLTLPQRRALKAVQTDTRVVEPFLAEELREVEFPVHMLFLQWHMEVLPRFVGQRPWQKLPFQWSIRSLDARGNDHAESFVAVESSDPRMPTITSLARALSDAGTVAVWHRGLPVRFRALLEDDPELKASVRELLNAPWLDLSSLIERTVYDPGFQGSFELPAVHRALCGGDLLEGLEIHDEQSADEAYRRILNSRTRAKTREKLGADLEAYGGRMAGAILDVFRALQAEVAKG
jgi:hypothetical protein